MTLLIPRVSAVLRSLRDPATLGLALILLVVGLYGSLKVVFAHLGVEPDTAHTVKLWQGVTEQGLPWIEDWNFTADNWLLSIVPFHFAAFAIFGPRVGIAILSGWLVFVASALLAGAIARQLGARRGAIFAVLALLNLGAYAHRFGLAAYSTSHDVTNLLGLAGVCLALTWIDRPRVRVLVFLAVVLVCGAVSDPWMLASYVLPLLLTGLALFGLNTPALGRRQKAGFVGVTALPLVAAQTKLFGLFGFLPDTVYGPADAHVMSANAIYLVRDLGGLANLWPSVDSNAFLPSATSLLIVVGFIQYQWIVAGRPVAVVAKVALLMGSLSLGGIAAALVVSNLRAQDYSARFLLNGVHVLVIASAVLAGRNWHRLGRPARWISLTLFVAFVTAGIASNANDMATPGLRMKDTGLDRIIRALDANGLTYGYGPYWGSMANAVTVATRDRIRLRPVGFDAATGLMLSGKRPQSSKRWYTDEDVPAGQKLFFVFVDPDGEECPVVDVCTNELARQFGAPVRTLRLGPSSILIWDHRLLGYGLPPIAVTFGVATSFSASGAFVNDPGWWPQESWGTWAKGSSGFVRVRLPRTAGDVRMTVAGRALLIEGHPSEVVVVSVDGQQVGTMRFDATLNQEPRTMTIPHALLSDAKDGVLQVEFRALHATSPKALGQSTDERVIGFGLRSLTFD